jgi:hypothetical protein
MEGLLVGLVALACPVSMGLMMWFMAKGARRGHNGHAEPAPSLEDLRAEHRRLGAEIERLQDGSRTLAKVDRD